VAVLFDCCPKSIKALAIRITPLDLFYGSYLSGDPLIPFPPAPTTPFTRWQTSGFSELVISPDYEQANETLMMNPAANSIGVVHRPPDQMKGFNLELKLCGMPTIATKLLDGLSAGNNLVDDFCGDTSVVGQTFNNDMENGGACLGFIIDLWSKNAATTCDAAGNTLGGYIHWVLPYTDRWAMSGGLNFNIGAAELSLSGYAKKNPMFYPSMPGPHFPSYQDFEPYVGGPAPCVLPAGVVADSWTVADMEQIRLGGALAYKCVDSLPGVLDDCGPVPQSEPELMRFSEVSEFQMPIGATNFWVGV
jgi:hypothetical protein